MILVEIRAAIIAQLQIDVPALKAVKEHGGRFGLKEIKAAASRSPAARVACLGLRKIFFEGAVAKAEVTYGIFVISSDQAAGRRDAIAMTMVAAIGAILPDNSWGLEASVDGAREIRADNLFSRDMDRQGIALWALTFVHTVDLDRVDATDLEDFLLAYIDYDLAPVDGNIDASDHIDLPISEE